MIRDSERGDSLRRFPVESSGQLARDCEFSSSFCLRRFVCECVFPSSWPIGVHAARLRQIQRDSRSECI